MYTSHNTQQCIQNKYSAKSVTENQQADAQPNSFAFKVSECQSVRQDSLLVDCGAIVHIVTDKSTFVRFEKNFKSSGDCVELADGSRSTGLVQSQGTAKVWVQSLDGRSERSTWKMHYISRHINKIFFLSRQQQRKELLCISAHFLRNVLLQMVLFLTFANQENCAISIMLLTELTINTVYMSGTYMILGHCNVKDLLKLESVVDGMKITDKSEFQCD